MNDNEKKRADDLDRAFLPVAWFILAILIISAVIGYGDHLTHLHHAVVEENDG